MREVLGSSPGWAMSFFLPCNIRLLRNIHYYRSGKQNLDADGLSSIREQGSTRTIFPDVLNTICHSVIVDIAQQPYVDTLTDADQEQLDPEEASTIQEEAIKGTAL